ncbi:MAG: hypothetical protein AB4050_08555 [Synechococcus sp.]
MSEDTPRERARNGDLEALETLLSELFGDEQAEARVQLEPSKLQVLLESTVPLDFESSLGAVLEAIADLAADNIETVSVYARRAGEYFPDWGQTTNLANLGSTSTRTNKGEYEFSANQNLSFSKLIQRMRQTSYCLLGIGIALIVPGILFFASGALEHVRGGVWVIVPGLSMSFFPGLLLLIDGFSKLWGARQLSFVVNTEGRDIEHVMTAVTLFRITHTVMAWVSAVALVWALVTVALFLPVFLALLQL